MIRYVAFIKRPTLQSMIMLSNSGLDDRMEIRYQRFLLFMAIKYAKKVIPNAYESHMLYDKGLI